MNDLCLEESQDGLTFHNLKLTEGFVFNFTQSVL
jgi:hypothetical protein